MSKKKKIIAVIIAMVLAVYGAGAASGIITVGEITGEMPLAVTQPILIDHTQFDVEDVSDHANRRFVSVSDDRTSFSAAAEIATGDEVVIDVPLINYSDNDASVELTLSGPEPLILYAEPFWPQEIYVKSTALGTITRTGTLPSPVPFTVTLEQSENATLSTGTQPATTVAISPQTAPSAGNIVAPVGVPATGNQTADSVVTYDPAGVTGLPLNTSQALTATSGAQPSGASGSSALWTTDNVDTAGNVGKFTSIAAVDASNIFISYRDDTNTGLKFAKTIDGGTSWTTDNVDTAGDVGLYTSIDAIDANTIFISYRDDANADLKFAKSIDGGTSWTTDNVDTAGETGWYTSIAAVDANTIFISYYDWTNENLKFAKSIDGGTSWTTDNVDTAGNVGWYTSIAAVDANTIFISYYNVTNADLKFAKSIDGGTSWTTDNVDTAGNVGYNTSISIVDANTIFISYYDVTNENLKFAKSIDGGTSWTTDNVDTAGNVGLDTSIVAVNASTIFISYYDATNRDLKFAKSVDSGTSWTASTLDAAFDNVGWYTSIAAVDASNIFISYYDVHNTNLKYAEFNAGSVWYPGTLSLDATGDAVTDTMYYVLTDLDGDSDIDRMELTSDDNTFGEGALSDNTTGGNNDELFDAGAGTSTSANITLGTYRFDVTFDHALTAGNATASVTSVTWFTGTFSIDYDADGATDTVNFALKDHTSDGLYDQMGLSVNDTDYGDGVTTNQVVSGTEDEVITGTEDVLVGPVYTFTFDFDVNPPADTTDAYATASTWFTGVLNLDANADGDKIDATDILYFALTDDDSDGIYEWMDLSLDDTTYGEGGSLGNKIVSTIGDDERIGSGALPEELRLGIYYFDTSFSTNPGGTATDASVNSTRWFTSHNFIGSPFYVDGDGDGNDDNPVAWVISDTNSDGLYDTIDLSMDDFTFGEGDTGNLRVGFTENDDEVAVLGDVLVFGDSTNADAPYFAISRLDPSPLPTETTPAADPDLDVGLMSPWYVGTFDIDIDGDQIAETLDFVIVDEGISEGIYNKLNIDRDDSGAYTADEVHESGDLILLGGMKIEVTFDTTAAWLNYRQGKIITVVYGGENRWLITVPAEADAGDTQDNVRIKICTPDDIAPGYFEVTGVFRIITP